jgi:hypothetical protein
MLNALAQWASQQGIHLIGLSELKGSNTDRIHEIRCADRNWRVWAHDQTGFLVSRKQFPDFKPVASSWTFTAAQVTATLICIAVYFPPEGSPRWTQYETNFEDELSKVTRVVEAFPDCVFLIGGDFNVRRDIPNPRWRLQNRASHPGHFLQVLMPGCRKTALKFLQVFKAAHEQAGSTNDVRCLTSLFRLRLGYNELGSSYHSVHFGASWRRECPMCHSEAETPVHFFLLCSAYDQPRTKFFGDLRTLFNRLGRESEFDEFVALDPSVVMVTLFRLNGPPPFRKLGGDQQSVICLMIARYIGRLFGIRGSRFH